MAERVVYLNGQYVAERDAKVSVLDRGFRWGDAVYDATRTFEGRLFKLHEHVERFFRSLRYARIDPRLDQAAVAAVCEEVVRRRARQGVHQDEPLPGRIRGQGDGSGRLRADAGHGRQYRGEQRPGVSLLTAVELAEKLGVPTDEGVFTMFDLYLAEEAMLTASPYCLLPVVKVNGLALGDGTPGPIVGRLLQAWSELVGMDIVAQATRHAG